MGEIGRFLGRASLLAAGFMALGWVLLLLDTFEEKSTGEGYEPIPEHMTLIALVCAVAMLAMTGAALVSVWWFRAVVPRAVALAGAGVVTGLTTLGWARLEDAASLAEISVVVGLGLLAAGVLLLVDGDRPRPPARARSRAVLVCLVFALAACLLVAGILFVAVLDLSTDLHMVGRFEEDENALDYFALFGTGSWVFLLLAMEIIRVLVRSNPWRVRSGAPEQGHELSTSNAPATPTDGRERL